MGIIQTESAMYVCTLKTGRPDGWLHTAPADVTGGRRQQAAGWHWVRQHAVMCRGREWAIIQAVVRAAGARPRPQRHQREGALPRITTRVERRPRSAAGPQEPLVTAGAAHMSRSRSGTYCNWPAPGQSRPDGTGSGGRNSTGSGLTVTTERLRSDTAPHKGGVSYTVGVAPTPQTILL